MASLPIRGRGLKLEETRYHSSILMSLPIRGRGLKQTIPRSQATCGQSLPIRGRGLKLGVVNLGGAAENVAPYTGAWIETIWV